MSELVFVTRRNCPLCAAARPLVERAAVRYGHSLAVRDVDDAGEADRYGARVPVVLRDGEEVLSGRFGKREVRRALR